MKRKFFLISIILVFALVSYTLAQVLPDTPADWSGIVVISGANASSGVIVESYVDGNLSDNVTTGTGFSCSVSDCSMYYLTHIPGSNGSSVTFKIYGVNVTQSAQSWSLGSHDLNLTVSNLSNGASCQYSQICSSGSCAKDFQAGAKYCAAAGKCTTNGTEYVYGSTLCSSSTTVQTCNTGTWTSSTCSNTCVDGACTSSGS